MSNEPGDRRKHLKWQGSSENLAHPFSELQKITAAPLSEQSFRSFRWNCSGHDEDAGAGVESGSQIWI